MIKKSLAWLLVLCMMITVLPLSVLATEETTETPTKGYMLYIYSDGETFVADCTNSASDFHLASALEDAYVFIDNPFMSGVSGTPYVVLDIYEDSIDDDSAVVVRYNTTLKSNGHLLTHDKEGDYSITVNEGVTLALNETTVDVDSLTNKSAVEVYGETTLNIDSASGNSIDLMEGAIIKDSTVGGAAYVGGNVTFRGDNTFTMLTDYGDYYSSETPSKWTVEKGASLTLTSYERYGLGYGDVVTVYGDLAEGAALTARGSLTTEDASINMYGGLVGMTNSASKNAQNKFIAEDAYLRFGYEGDKSFGNKSGSYYGNYTFSFDNIVMDANGYKFYEDMGSSTVTYKDSDLEVGGVFMTNDASSTFTFENTKIVSKATSNGTDDKNQNAGVMTLTDSDLTYSAPFTNVGTVNMNIGSKLTAPTVNNAGTITIDAEGLTAGEEIVLIEQTSETAESLEGKITLVNGENVAVNYDGGDVKIKYMTTPNASVSVLEAMTLKANEYMIWPSGDDEIDRPLDIVMNFKANETLAEAKAGGFGKWKVDFYLEFEGLANGSIVADNCYLAGNYGSFGWIVIPADGLELEEGISYPVVSAYDANITYEQICGDVKDFTAAIHVDEAILAANPEFKVSLSLKMTNPEDASDVIVVGQPAVYDKSQLTNAESKWTTDTDAGTYTDGDDTYGMMRFLFAYDIDADKVIRSGIKYLKSSDILVTVDSQEDVAGGDNIFYGDIIGIPTTEDTTATYYAFAYIETTEGTFWSSPLGCSPNFENHFENYTLEVAE